jgi:isocitrate/isopropylmalate dehydrogenase
LQKKYRIACIAGDGSGPELMRAGQTLLKEISGDRIELINFDIGLSRWEKTKDMVQGQGKCWGGISIHDLDRLKETDAMFYIATAAAGFPAGITGPYSLLRSHLGLFADVRPALSLPNSGALRPDLDITMVREVSEGLWGAVEFMQDDTAFIMSRISKKGTERIARAAFNLARTRRERKVTCAHKGQVSRTGFIHFRDVVKEVAKEFPDVQFEEMHTDVVPYVMVRDPEKLDVVLVTSFAGDIISGVLAALTGAVGVSPAAIIGENYGLFRPSHGTVPGKAGKNTANPIASFLGLKMMFEWLAQQYQDGTMKERADRLGRSITNTLADRRFLTTDLGGTATTTQVTEGVIKNY